MLNQLRTEGGVFVEYEQYPLIYCDAVGSLIEKLDSQRGALFTSGFEYPGRYSCWDIGFCNPPLVLTVKHKIIVLDALNKRGETLLAMLIMLLEPCPELLLSHNSTTCQVTVNSSKQIFNEEHRSQQPSLFTLIRKILAFFKTKEEPYLGLYGAFAYDLIFQFETLHEHQIREDNQRDLVLYLPDEIYVVNHNKELAFIRRYDFQFHGKTTEGLNREGEFKPYEAKYSPEKSCDHEPNEYANVVEKAKTKFACGDLFEVVPSQTFFANCGELPSTIFKRMCEKNPSPYGFFINLGNAEYLVGASPEMFVRVQGRRVETCPISGTIKRGVDAIEDAKNIQTLLDSEKEFSELTMCTDVDRNDKSRICEPGSVNVIGRRLIEIYSRLIHTVDHVEGIIRDEFDAVDAFLTHMWVVTVTGAPKIWAMQFIEQHEKSSRRWYGGAVGWFSFNGNLNTGLVLRTLRIEEGIAEIRVGATLLYDSVPELEEEETRLKASAFLDILAPKKIPSEASLLVKKSGENKRVLLIDHQDSFVHTLANYIRQTGATVETIRYQHALDYLDNYSFDLVVLSPGPGSPDVFNMKQTIAAVLKKQIPLFGVCLGLQAIVEYFGGQLGQLAYPVHGKASTIIIKKPHPLLAGLDSEFTAGRYHSLYALPQPYFPQELDSLAATEDNIIMAVAHKDLPIYAVQFHPETILSLGNEVGMKIIYNLLNLVDKH